MHVGDPADRPESGLTRPTQVPRSASRVEWKDVPNPDNPYGVIETLLAAGIDAARIHLYDCQEESAFYWVVTLDGGHMAVLTDDTEEHVSNLDGPWPFKATLVTPEGVRTEIDHDLQVSTAQIVTWYIEAAGASSRTT